MFLILDLDKNSSESTNDKIPVKLKNFRIRGTQFWWMKYMENGMTPVKIDGKARGGVN